MSNRATASPQPQTGNEASVFDVPLALGLTPRELFHVVPNSGLAFEMSVGASTNTDPGRIFSQIVARNPRTGFECRLIFENIGIDRMITVELHAAGKIVAADCDIEGEVEWVLCKAAANEIFRLWCAVIGIRISMQPVVELPPAS